MERFSTLPAGILAVGLTVLPEDASAQWRGGWRGGGFGHGSFGADTAGRAAGAWRGGWEAGPSLWQGLGRWSVGRWSVDRRGGVQLTLLWLTAATHPSSYGYHRALTPHPMGTPILSRLLLPLVPRFLWLFSGPLVRGPRRPVNLFLHLLRPGLRDARC